MSFGNYAAQDVKPGHIHTIKLIGLRNRDGSVPSVGLRGIEGNTGWEEAVILDSIGSAILENDAEKKADQDRRLRARVGKHLIATMENVFHEDGSVAQGEDDAIEFASKVPMFVVMRMVYAANNTTNYQDVNALFPASSVEDIAKK